MRNGPTKICHKCGKELPLTPRNFYRNSAQADGYDVSCKKCRSKGRHRQSWKSPAEQAPVIQDLLRVDDHIRAQLTCFRRDRAKLMATFIDAVRRSRDELPKPVWHAIFHMLQNRWESAG